MSIFKRLRCWEIQWHKRRLKKLGVDINSEEKGISRKRLGEVSARLQIARKYFYLGGGDPASPDCPKITDFVRW